MSSLRTIALPILADNYVWLLADQDDRVLIVDPGDAQPVLRALSEGLNPQAILITHHHHDHIDGLDGLLAHYDIPCYAPDDNRIAGHLTRIKGGTPFVIPEMDLPIDVIAVPGHTSSHVAYLAGGYLFCGDTLFSLGCGRLFEGTAHQMLNSLDTLAALPEATHVCCAHEYTVANGRFAVQAERDNPERDAWLAHASERLRHGLPSLPSSIGNERRCNPFLRCDSPAIIAAVSAQLGQRPAGRLQTFTALRRWKDMFQ